MAGETSSGPEGPPLLLDEIDYLAQATGVREEEVQRLLPLQKFQAAVLAFVNEKITLGYAAFFSRTEVAAAIPNITAERLVGIIKHVARRVQLDNSDKRHLAVDVRKLAVELFPELYWDPNDPAERQRFYEKIDREMRGSEEISPWKKFERRFSDLEEDRKYVSYWIDHSEDRIIRLFSDPNFAQKFEAYRDWRFPYRDFIKELYGPGSHIIFPELGWHMSGLALIEIAQRINRGALTPCKTEHDE